MKLKTGYKMQDYKFILIAKKYRKAFHKLIKKLIRIKSSIN